MQRSNISLIKILEKQAPIIGDGAKPTVFSMLGWDSQKYPFQANLTDHSLVKNVHQKYLDVGSTILRTNTEGAHRLQLDRLSLGDRCEAINNSAMALLRESAGYRAMGAGCISMIPKELGPAHLREQAYGEQIIYLCDTGANFLVFQDFDDLEEFERALLIANRTSHMETIFHWTLSNQDIKDVILLLQNCLKKGATYVGLQSSPTTHFLEDIKLCIDELGIVSIILDEVSEHISQKPSESFINIGSQILQQDIAMFWGGCRTTEMHIKALLHSAL